MTSYHAGSHRDLGYATKEILAHCVKFHKVCVKKLDNH
jgi:hypothetical protein